VQTSSPGGRRLASDVSEEAPFAPRVGSQAEDGDAILVSFLTNLNTDRGECAIFDAREITRGPICRIELPSHIPLGAHAFWAGAEMLAG
jgi:carotenoid cleavage dioxygenase